MTHLVFKIDTLCFIFSGHLNLIVKSFIHIIKKAEFFFCQINALDRADSIVSHHTTDNCLNLRKTIDEETVDFVH